MGRPSESSVAVECNRIKRGEIVTDCTVDNASHLNHPVDVTERHTTKPAAGNNFGRYTSIPHLMPVVYHTERSELMPARNVDATDTHTSRSGYIFALNIRTFGLKLLNSYESEYRAYRVRRKSVSHDVLSRFCQLQLPGGADVPTVYSR